MIAMGGLPAAAYIGMQTGQTANEIRGCIQGATGDCVSVGVTVASSVISVISVYTLKSTMISPSGVSQKPSITLALSKEDIAKMRASQVGMGEITGARPIDHALKPDITHRAAVFLQEEAEIKGYMFWLKGYDGVMRRYIQVPFEGGIADFIIDANGNLTHSMIRAGRKVTGNWGGK